MKKRSWILIVIILSQFCCTSLWFAGNGIISDLMFDFQLTDDALSYLTSSVQFGFIMGTLAFAIFTISDRFAPSKVFFWSAVFGAVSNLAIMWNGHGLYSLIFVRFFTGFFLAGIYPVGMKIAADHFEKGLGKSLGFLVGALVIGTSFPHLLNANSENLSWETVVMTTSGLALLGGILILVLVPDGPYRIEGGKPDLSKFFKVFADKGFRSAAFGYFGHMWELYAFWAYLPFILTRHLAINQITEYNISFWSFLIIAVGGPACAISGFVAGKYGNKKVAQLALTTSGFCCLISPLVLAEANFMGMVLFLSFWSMFVIADSPLFSTLVAYNIDSASRGTAFTIVNCIGFAITIISIQTLNFANDMIAPNYLLVPLALGPALGILSLSRE